MNKFERRLKGYYKFKKRLKNYRVGSKEMINVDSPAINYALKTTGKPCSCYLCSGKKYNRKIKHKNDNI